MTLREIKSLKMWENVKFEGKNYYVVSTYGAQGNAYGIVIEDGASGNQKYLKEKDFRGVMKNSANSSTSTNPVVQNALAATARNAVSRTTPLKRIDSQCEEYWPGGKLGDLVDEYKMNKSIRIADNYLDTMARDRLYDALYELTGIKNRWAVR